MRFRIKKLSEGFTIIELMIVLAIVGVIMAIVFLAIPQLQRNTRDNQRQAAVSRIKSEIETYGSTNNGAYPLDNTNGGTFTTFYNSSISGKVNDTPNGQSMWLGGDGTKPASFIFTCAGNTSQNAECTNTASKLTAAGVAAGSTIIVPYGKCSDGGTTNTTANQNKVWASQTVPATPSKTTSLYAMVTLLDRGNLYCIDNG